MTHWRIPNTSGRLTVGAHRQPSASRADTPREYINRYFPSGSILAEPVSSPLERRRFPQALIDILALGSFALLICSCAAAGGILGYVFWLKYIA